MGGLRGFILKRLLLMAVTLYVLMTILFFLFRVLPGDPTSIYLAEGISPQAQEVLIRRFGLDRPLNEQYFLYMGNLLSGDFGLSFTYNKPALEVIAERIPPTIILALTAYLLAISLGIVLGAIFAWKRGRKVESLGVTGTLILRCMPAFWSGMMVLFIFSYKLGWFPDGGLRQPGTSFTGFWDKYISLDFLHHLFLPALTAAIHSLASPLLVMRSSMLEIIDEDFIEMARAKGLSEFQVLFRHAARNALLPVTTVAAIMIGFSIGGIVLVEVVFRWPGMGREIVSAVTNRDYPVAQAAFFFIGLMVITFNFIADLLYGFLDPRVEWE